MMLLGRMVSFATWQKFIEASSGSAAMKRRVINLIRDRVREGELIDSFMLGLTLGEVSRKLSAEELRDFEATILLTRDLNNVPIVQVQGQPVMTLSVRWIDRHREPQEKPDPLYPNGIDDDLSRGASATCQTLLPYPAKRIGYYFIKCDTCGLTTIVTTAGRPDDPRSVNVACREPRP